MLNLHEKEVGLPPPPWKSVREPDGIVFPHASVITDSSLSSWIDGAAEWTGMTVYFQLVMGRCWSNLARTDFQPEVKGFFELLEKLGAIPHFRGRLSRGHASFWFDVSSESNPAYYLVTTADQGQKLVTAVFYQAIDLAIVQKVQTLDRTLRSLGTRIDTSIIHVAGSVQNNAVSRAVRLIRQLVFK